MLRLCLRPGTKAKRVLRLMADHFDIVSVGVEKKGRIVPPTVLRTKSRRSVVLPACAKSGAIERIDLMSALSYECNV